MTLRSIIEKSGAEYLGIRGDLIYFNDPKTKTTLSLPDGKITRKAIVKKMEESRERFKDKAKEK